MKNLAQLRHSLATMRAKKRPYRRLINRAAVAVIMREHATELQVLLIKRASSLNDRWSGHIAFPGGRLESDDSSTCYAAIRETKEETGIELSLNNKIGRLSDVMTVSHNKLRPMVVSPYVFALQGEPELVQNYEVADTFWVDLNYLKDSSNHSHMTWQGGKVPLRMPCINLKKDYCLWGLTYKMVSELNQL